MILFITKVVGAALIIAFASWLSGQNPKLAGFIIALPLVSLIAIAFSYYEHNDIEKTIYQYNGPQTLLASDRITINSKINDITLSSFPNSIPFIPLEDLPLNTLNFSFTYPTCL